jgi:hypothetical protein
MMLKVAVNRSYSYLKANPMPTAEARQNMQTG